MTATERPSPFERGGYLGNSAFGAVTNNCWFEPQFRTDIRSALDTYKVASDTGHIPKELGASGYPPDLKSLYAGVEDAASEKKAMLYFLRRLPRDPFFPDGTVPPEQSWGLRSYASPPDDPQPGDDVYDIYSLDKGVGLNEVHYHDW